MKRQGSSGTLLVTRHPSRRTNGMKRRGMPFGALHRLWFYSVAGALFLSGAAWVLFGWLGGRNEVQADFYQSLQEWALKLHGAAAMAFLVALGILIPAHVKPAWRMRWNRTNGVLLAAVVALLVMSGYGLYYFGDEQWRSAASWIHLILGLAIPALLGLHVWIGRRATRRFYAQQLDRTLLSARVDRSNESTNGPPRLKPSGTRRQYENAIGTTDCQPATPGTAYRN